MSEIISSLRSKQSRNNHAFEWDSHLFDLGPILIVVSIGPEDNSILTANNPSLYSIHQ